MAEEVYVSFETGGDDINILGDYSGIELWEAQRFTTAAEITCTSASIYIFDKNKTPDGDLSFRIETSVENEPSGTLIHADAECAVPFAEITLEAWNKASFTKFTLPAGTYWLVIKIPDQARSENYGILCDWDGIGWEAYSDDHGETWQVGENCAINYFRIYKEIVVAESKFRDEICFKGLPGGTSIRGQINKEFIYAVKNKQQRKYAYFVPTNPQTAPQQAWRTTFTAGVAAALALTESQKDVYRKEAYRRPGQTWFTRFMTWYLWKESHS